MTYLLDTNVISHLMRADTRIEAWMAGLNDSHRIVTCTIVRGEILFGISRLPHGRREFLEAFHCEGIPERAGVALGATLVSRNIDGLRVVTLA